MKQEEGELLLKDISARLSYGVKGLAYIAGEPCNTDTNITGIINKSIVTEYESPILDLINLGSKDITIKLYLRPLSSMTEEEKKEYNSYTYHVELGRLPFHEADMIDVDLIDEFADWLNAHHFDYRCLIEKGLALEAPEGMYNFK